VLNVISPGFQPGDEKGSTNENLEAVNRINGWIDIERLMIESFIYPLPY
jgi:hypothetical protein